MLTEYVNSKIHRVIEKVDKSEQLQSVIDPELNFRRNSINLYIGRRGSGKTFNVLRELIKLSQLPDRGGFNSFIYCTDKTNDSTVKDLLPLIKLKTRIVSYADMLTFMKGLIDAKMAYEQIIEKNLTTEVTDRCKKDLLKAVDVTHFGDRTPGTVVLYDDAINIFKSMKNKPLLDLLHQNRQPKITYFLCMQDGFALPPQVKRNLDTCILFGGFNYSQMLNILLRQLNSSSTDNNELGRIYRSLTNREGIIFDYLPDETVVKILDS
ncbi:hypothetical protein FACS189472_07740 [Alphaproteobacteria bacterium]|nr:hypothetical protein FACS189472_07740 [Alphaproteobacteria bacterium]